MKVILNFGNVYGLKKNATKTLNIEGADCKTLGDLERKIFGNDMSYVYEDCYTYACLDYAISEKIFFNNSKLFKNGKINWNLDVKKTNIIEVGKLTNDELIYQCYAPCGSPSEGGIYKIITDLIVDFKPYLESSFAFIADAATIYTAFDHFKKCNPKSSYENIERIINKDIKELKVGFLSVKKYKNDRLVEEIIAKNLGFKIDKSKRKWKR